MKLLTSTHKYWKNKGNYIYNFFLMAAAQIITIKKFFKKHFNP